MDSFWYNILPIIGGIGATLLGGLIGWHLRRAHIKELEDINDEKHAEYTHLKNAHEMLDLRNNNLQKEHVSLSVSHNSLSEKNVLLEQEHASLSISHNVLAEKSALLEEEQASLSESNISLQEKIQLLEEDLAAMKNAKTVVTKHFVNYRTTTENRLEELAQATQEWTQKHNFLLTRYESQNNRLADLENLNSLLEDDYNKLNAEKQDSDTYIAELKILNDEKENSLLALIGKYESGNNDMSELQALNDAKENNLIALINKHETSNNHIAELQALNDEWEESYLMLVNQQETRDSKIAELQVFNDELETKYLSLLNQHDINNNRIAELQTLNEEKENKYAALVNQQENSANRIYELQTLNDQWALAFEELDNEQSIAKAQTETLQHALASIEENNDAKYANSDSSLKLYEKELGDLQEAKAQLEITRIKLENELEILRGNHTQVSADYNALIELEKAGRMRLDYLEQQNFEQRIAELEAQLENLKNEGKGHENGHSVVMTSATPDDLKVVEGIGPKIEAVLHDAGILTFEQLAKTDPERINAILDAAGPRYRIHNPSTWPSQAELAAKNDWDKLKELKEYLLAGRDRATQ